MFVHRFHAGHFDALRQLFAPRKPRHPLLRLALGLVGVALLAVLVVVSLFVGAAMLLVAAGMRLLRMGQRRQPRAADARVVEGEYRVVGKPTLRAAKGPALHGH